jgi:hypothetical protein
MDLEKVLFRLHVILPGKMIPTRVLKRGLIDKSTIKE